MIDRLFGSDIFSNSFGKEGGTTHTSKIAHSLMDPDTVEKTEACFFLCLTNHKVGMQKSIDASKSAGEGKKKIGAISKKTPSPSMQFKKESWRIASLLSSQQKPSGLIGTLSCLL